MCYWKNGRREREVKKKEKGVKTVFIWPSKIKSLGSSNMIKVKRIDDFFLQ